MSDPFIGEIRIFAGNFAPRDWVFCKGQLLSIAQESTLFALIGTTYGGDGQSTFAVPDLRGRAPVHQGRGSGLGTYVLGQSDGLESVTLTSQQMPMHSHGLVHGGVGSQASPQNGLLGTTPARDFRYSDASANTNLAAAAMQPQGGNMPHENRSPFLALNFIICVNGIFPSPN